MGHATHLLTKARAKAAGLFAAAERACNRAGDWLRPETRIVHGDDGAVLDVFRRRLKSGSIITDKRIRLGPNHVHAFITHADDTITDLGLSKNLLTNIGRDVMAGMIGGFPAAGNTVASDILTAVGASSATGTGSVWTASNLATPQLGLAAKQIWAAPHTTTNPVVYGNIVSNTTNVITIDKWWKIDDTTGTTPTNADAFAISIGYAPVRFMALTTDSGAASAADTVLASEITTNGGGRALATYAHTFGTATFTLQKAYSITGTLTAIHKMGLFCCLSAAGADPMFFETVLNADATVVNGDTLTVTDTVTCSG